ncbi:glutamine synthetase family protein [Oligoflexus tunisiensis]|uniref:glutamine synthetase family protein n=1 Tax=Oligoflexus tunisiensis TaxID=708132 RepID=UPI000A8CE5E8|nr:glutamine synthetase family protein [Oligoflexus tunisiensis]
MADQEDVRIKAVLKQLEDAGHQKVKVAVADIDGILRGKYLNFDKFKSASQKGFGFCNVVFGWDSADVCYDSCTYTGWHSGYPDALAKIDPGTERVVPWDGNVPFFLGEFYEQDGRTPLEICPRQVLKKVLKKAEGMGYNVMAGCEFEWFNFQESAESLEQKNYCVPTPLTPGMFGYSILRSSQYSDFFNDLIDLHRNFRVPLEGVHTETGPGVYEAAIQVSNGLEAADRAILFKTGTKEIAQKHGILASFMAKWNARLPGCSGHIHLSLCQGDKNLFYADDDPNCMSPVFKKFLAGLIRYTPEFLVMMAPTVNSYKRLVKGYWAPTSSTWGLDNRTCAFRVIPWGASSTRVEVRVPGADMNPYLSLAASVAAGLKGIEQNLSLEQAQVQGSGYDSTDAAAFPSNLQEAATAFANSEVARTVFGERFVKHYSETRFWEWEQSQKAVTDWEIKRYFEII